MADSAKSGVSMMPDGNLLGGRCLDSDAGGMTVRLTVPPQAGYSLDFGDGIAAVVTADSVGYIDHTYTGSGPYPCISSTRRLPTRSAPTSAGAAGAASSCRAGPPGLGIWRRTVFNPAPGSRDREPRRGTLRAARGCAGNGCTGACCGAAPPGGRDDRGAVGADRAGPATPGEARHLRTFGPLGHHDDG
jgi:hypothetical protein